MSVPILTLREFANHLIASNGPHVKWGQQIADLIEEAAVNERLAEDVDEVICRSEIDQAPGASYQDGVDALAERYHHVRNALSERFDVDLAAAEYVEAVDRVFAQAEATDFFRIRIRTALRDLGVITDANDDGYVVAVLKALLG